MTTGLSLYGYRKYDQCFTRGYIDQDKIFWKIQVYYIDFIFTKKKLKSTINNFFPKKLGFFRPSFDCLSISTHAAFKKPSTAGPRPPEFCMRRKMKLYAAF